MISQSLIDLGKRRGYLTYGQMNEALSEEEIEDAKLAELILFLDDNGIDVIDESEVEEREDEIKESESFRRAYLHFIHSAHSKLDLIRKCKSTPAVQRLAKGCDLRWKCGRTYLMEQLVLVGERPNRKWQHVPNPIHKIGKTDRKWKLRSSELWRSHRLVQVHTYPTVIAMALEQTLHLQYDEYRIRRQGEHKKGQRRYVEGERFRLPEDEVSRFPATVAAVEAWVLCAEEARIELELLQAPIMAKKLGIALNELLP